MKNDGIGKLNLEMLKALGLAQIEAKRGVLVGIPPILVLKAFLYSKNSFIKNCILGVGKTWDVVETEIKKQVVNYADEEDVDLVVDFMVSVPGDKAIVFYLTQELFTILSSAIDYSSDGITIDELSFLKATINMENKYVYNFFYNIKLSPQIVDILINGVLFEREYSDYEEEAGYDYSEESIYGNESSSSEVVESKNNAIEIPHELEDCLEVMHSCPFKDNLIRGREKETQALIRTLLKYKKSNAILVGKKGVGKTAIIENLAYKIAINDVPDSIKNKVIVSLDVSNIIAGTMYRGQAEEKFKILRQFLEKQKDIILFVDEIHNMIGAGRTTENSLDLSNSLKPLLARNGVSVIGATTDVEYEKYFAKDEAFRRRFEKITVKEPKYDEVYPMIEAQVKNLSNIHGVKYSRHVIDFIIMTAGCFNFETHNPDLALDLVDKSMAAARLEGKFRLTPEIVLSNFEADFQLYSEMSEETKMGTAFHEAGHYLVDKYGKHSKGTNALAISIIPTGDYLGVSVSDNAKSNLITWDYKTHISYIASLLAGRIAESMYTNKINSGAANDLEKATEHARDMILRYGLVTNFLNRNYEKDCTEKHEAELNKSIDNIIKEATNLARLILDEHEVTLKAIAEKLCEKGMLIRPELEKICKENEGKVVENKHANIF